MIFLLIVCACLNLYNARKEFVEPEGSLLLSYFEFFIGVVCVGTVCAAWLGVAA